MQDAFIRRSRVLGGGQPFVPQTQPGYVGPGDVVSGAVAFWGIRAYSLAKIGTHAVRLRRDSDNTEQDFGTVSPTGDLDWASINTFAGGANLFVRYLYDQIGNNDVGQATASQQPQLVANVVGGKPALTFLTANFQGFINFLGCTIDLVQPVTGIAVSRMTVAESNGGTTPPILAGTGGGFGIYWSFDPSGHGLDEYYGGADQIWKDTDSPPSPYLNTWSAIQWTADGSTNGLIHANGLDSPALTIAGGNALLIGQSIVIGADLSGAGQFTGNVNEAGYWPFVFTAGQIAVMNSNQRGYWGI